MMIGLGAILVWLAMLWAGDTATGRAMRRVLVDAPARWCSRWTRGQLISWALIFVGFGAAILVMEQEGMALVAMASPELLMLLASVEFTGLVDLIAAAVLTAGSMRFGLVRAWIVARLAPRGRAVRTRPARREMLPSNDDEDGGWALAA
jgi:hypothetical protein